LFIFEKKAEKPILMIQKRIFLLLFFFVFIKYSIYYSQTFVFAQLTGSPNLNTAGWNLTGNAYSGDTGGDPDASPNELILTNAAGNQSGGVFYGTPINPLICSKWTVEFDYRIWGGSAADGLAFCFLDVPPTGFVSGGGVGIPGTANGLKVILDTWDNGCGVNPEVQIYSGVGYNECIAGIVKLTNSGNNLNFIRSNAYQPVKITYVNGVVTLFINNTQYLTANFPINFAGYMGFTASTGGATDQHSIRNAIIYTDQATSNAGTDVSYCSGESATIGTASNASNVYSWSPSTGLDNPNIANPTVSLTNNGTSTITQTYTVTTSLASNPGICPTTDQVTVTVFPNLDITLNTSICDGDTYNFNGQSLTTTGNYIANLTTINGCDSIVTLNLTVNPITSTVVDSIICQGATVVIGGQNLQTTGQYNFTFQSQNGCDSLVTLNLVVNPLPVVTCSSVTICAGETAVLTPSGASSYVWSPQIGSVNSQGILTVSPSSSTNFTLTGTDANNCVNSIPVSVTVNPLPIILLAANQPDYCVGDNIIIQASGALTYTWGQFSGNGSQQSLTAQASAVYSISGTDVNNCANTQSISITVFPNPTLTVTPDQAICLGEIVLVNVTGANSYVWSPAGSGSQSYLSPNNTTTYSITGTDLNNCSSQLTTTVTVYPLPQALVEATPLITTSDSPFISFTNNSIGATTSTLTVGDGVVYDNFDSQVEHTYPFSEGNYSVALLVENQYGCFDSTELVIQIKGDEIFYVPNTFTPDGDEHNHVFSPVFTAGFDPANFQLEIYNRWGELLFQSLNASKAWDGLYNNVVCPVGTYTWKIIYKIPDTDEYKVVSGLVNLLR
jgi:gliding motility-associated-like protein